MTGKRWTISVLGLIAALLMAAGLFVHQVDPLWCFNDPNSLNLYRTGFNERQQKVNYLHFVNHDYNALILGSSRTTYMDATLFAGYRAFNFAANSMNPTEYESYLDYFKRQTGKAPELVIIGLDFWGTNANDTADFERPQFYFDEASSFLYRAKGVISIDAARQAIKVAVYNKGSLPDDEALYDQQLNKREFGDNESLREQRIRTQSMYYSQVSYGNYVWRSNYDSLLVSLKDHNPDTRFVVFTTPVTDSLLSVLMEQGRLEDYHKWLQTLVNVFGNVNHFMYPNHLSADVNGFYDLQHFKPEVGVKIASFLQQGPGDIETGLVIDQYNLQPILEDMDKRFSVLTTSKN